MTKKKLTRNSSYFDDSSLLQAIEKNKKENKEKAKELRQQNKKVPIVERSFEETPLPQEINVVYKTKSGQTKTKSKIISPERLKKYGKIGTTTEGETLYAEKITYQTKTGKTVTKAKVINKSEYLKVNGVYKKYDESDIETIRIKEFDKRTGQTVYKTKLEDMKRIKYVYKKVGKHYEKKKGAQYYDKRKVTDMESSEIPNPGKQVTGTVTFEVRGEINDSNGNLKYVDGQRISMEGISRLQTRNTGFSLEEMEEQAINYAISQFITSSGIPGSNAARALIVEDNLYLSKRIG